MEDVVDEQHPHTSRPSERLMYTSRPPSMATTILEIWQPNVEMVASQFPDFRVILGDVRRVATYFEPKQFEVSIWFHGPEHCIHNEAWRAIAELEHLTKQLVILGCPWGAYQQGPVDGNVWETHLSTFYPEDFQAIGYQTDTLGKKDQRGSNILAWKRLTAPTQHD